MSDVPPILSVEPSFQQECEDLEAFQTPRWAVDAVLKVEILTSVVVDPCCGDGVLTAAARAAGYGVMAIDIRDWRDRLLAAIAPDIVTDFLALDEVYPAGEFSALMNPPFSKACEFIDKAFSLGARKVVCFQRYAWRESKGRREWWEKNRPSRIWLCGDRASCWRFDQLDCKNPEGVKTCPRKLDKKSKWGDGCQSCRGNVPTAHAFFVFERGHAGAELTGVLYKDDAS